MHIRKQEIYQILACFHIFAFSHFRIFAVFVHENPKNAFHVFHAVSMSNQHFSMSNDTRFHAASFFKLAINTTVNSCFRAFREMPYIDYTSFHMKIITCLLTYIFMYYPSQIQRLVLISQLPRKPAKRNASYPK